MTSPINCNWLPEALPQIDGVYLCRCGNSKITFKAYFYKGIWYSEFGLKICFGDRNPAGGPDEVVKYLYEIPKIWECVEENKL